METLSQLILEFKTRDPELIALKRKHDGEPLTLTYKELYNRVLKVSSFLLKIGLKKGDKAGIISDNKLEWMISDLGCQLIGLIDVPRGSAASEKEIEYIYNHADVRVTFVENEIVLKRFLNIKNIPEQEYIIVMDENFNNNTTKIIGIKEAEKIGEEYLKQISEDKIIEIAKSVLPEDIATLIYTSGTTGVPKGVMLTHSNIVSNIVRLPDMVDISRTNRFLAILPTWHSYERTVEYTLLYVRGENIYSKPAPSILLKDLEEENPHYLVSVPRVWEGLYSGIKKAIKKQGNTKYKIFNFFANIAILKFRAFYSIKNQFPVYSIEDEIKRILKIPFNIIALIFLAPLYFIGNILVFNKIRKRLGNSFKAGISGGGALPKFVDEFFNSLNIKVLEGYGLTETSPVVAVRRINHPIFYTIGDLVPDTKIEIRDENERPLKKGEHGIIWIKGPQVMKGYYKQEEMTEEVLKNGWFNSGDIGVMDLKGYVKITGRAKNTIVLLSGENIEPEPIEEKLVESNYIKTAVVLGQDQRFLAALIVPDYENLRIYFSEKLNKNDVDVKEMAISIDTRKLIFEEIRRLISFKNGFKRYEFIGNFAILENEFEPGKELTHTLKLRRGYINQAYKDIISNLFKK